MSALRWQCSDPLESLREGGLKEGERLPGPGPPRLMTDRSHLSGPTNVYMWQPLTAHFVHFDYTFLTLSCTITLFSTVVCLHAALWAQSFASMGNRWLHNALWYHWTLVSVIIGISFRRLSATNMATTHWLANNYWWYVPYVAFVFQPHSRYGGFEIQENHRFHQLLCSKYFLLVFIRTLEAREKEFSTQDKLVTTLALVKG